MPLHELRAATSLKHDMLQVEKPAAAATDISQEVVMPQERLDSPPGRRFVDREKEWNGAHWP